MKVRNGLEYYLSETDVINYSSSVIQELAIKLRVESLTEIDLINKSYEFVRDNIKHSADINSKHVTCIASDVLIRGEGICYAKSHLLAALLRANNIPCGFCYQRLILNDIEAPYLILHGLNAIYIKEMNKWVRADARGNKKGVNAIFSLDEEQLAFEVREHLHEEDIDIVFDKPDCNVIEALMKYDTVGELFNNLPKNLANGNLLDTGDE